MGTPIEQAVATGRDVWLVEYTDGSKDAVCGGADGTCTSDDEWSGRSRRSSTPATATARSTTPLRPSRRRRPRQPRPLPRRGSFATMLSPRRGRVVTSRCVGVAHTDASTSVRTTP